MHKILHLQQRTFIILRPYVENTSCGTAWFNLQRCSWHFHVTTRQPRLYKRQKRKEHLESFEMLK